MDLYVFNDFRCFTWFHLLELILCKPLVFIISGRLLISVTQMWSNISWNRSTTLTFKSPATMI